MRTTLTAFAFLTCLACGPAELSINTVDEFAELGINEGEARISVGQAEAAKAIVDGTKQYLPYAYTEDGCYARALYMSMELGARRVPTSAQYLSGYLQPSASVSWGWHVAPMVEIGGSTTRTILDPALAPTGPIPLTEWIRRSNPQGSYELYWTLGSVYVTESYGLYRNAQSEPVIQSFSELRPFRTDDVEEACGVMHDYLNREGSSASVRTAKQKLLLGRTRTLANRLLSVGKLTGYSAGASLRCGGRQVPVCRENNTSCARSDDCCSTLCSNSVCQPRPADLVADPFDGPGAMVDAGTTARPDAGTATALDAGVGVGVGGTSLRSDVPVTGLSATAGTFLNYTFDVPAGATGLRFVMQGGAGDADLYVRYGAAPTLTSYDHRPYAADSNETVTPTMARAGRWYVMVHAYSAISGVRLTASYAE